jgi:all-trans-nonaprenyl-diphosphate synthase
LEEKPYLEVLIEREFAQPDDIPQALALVKESQGIERSRALAAHHAQIAVQSLAVLKPSTSAQTLIDLADYVLSRLY